MNRKFQKSLLLIFSLLALVAISLPVDAKQTPHSSQLTCFQTLWPQEKSALVADPTVVYGKLENGFRYIIKNNNVPEKRVALNFYIGAGSLNETSDERGYAHFLEHMLFNGTENFPPGKLIEYFQSIGMDFGADTNAYTTYDRTVYSIVLPENNLGEFREGLQVVADYARKALLLDSEVERERGVILAEKTARDSVSYRMSVASRENALQGTLLAQREPIGTEESIKNATGESLRRFYDKWYRPENMVLVVVGDIDIQAAEEEIRQMYRDMQGVGEQPPCPDLGTLDQRGIHSFYLSEPEAGDVDVTLESYWQQEWQNDSYELQMEQLRRYIATTVIEKRLERIAEKGEGLFSRPNSYSGDFFDRIGYSGVSVSTTESKWQDALSILEKTLREALEFGVSKEEIDIIKNEVRAYYLSQVQQAPTRKSTDLTRAIIWNLSNNRVFQSPEQEWNNYARTLPSIRVEDINNTLKRLFARDDQLIEVMGNVVIDEEQPEKKILEVYDTARKQPIAQYNVEARQQFPYFQPAEQAEKPVTHTRHGKIDADVYTFANGTVLNLKQTDFEDNQLRILVEFGPGKQGEPLAGLSSVAESVISRSGTGRMTASEIDDALSGSSVSFSFEIDKTTFRYSGKSLSEETDTLIKTLYTLYSDPGFRKSAYRNTMIALEKMYDSMRSDIRGAERLHFQRFFAGGNTLFGLEPWESVKNIQLEQVREWLQPVFEDAVPQISVVGDFDAENVLDLVGRTFAALPSGKLYTPKPESIRFPIGEEYIVKIPSQLDKSLVTYGFAAEGFRDIQTVRRLGMLASVLEERVRVEIRERIGAAYSPYAYYAANRFFPEYGTLFARIIVDDDKIEEVRKAVQEIAVNLQQNGTTEEELLRVKNPVLTTLRDRKKTNDYWLKTVLSQSANYPEQLQWPTTILEDHASITVEEINDLARQYLDPTKAAAAVARPVKE